VFAALLIPAGQLGDRYSRRKLFLCGLAIFTLASGCCAIAPTLGALIACRVIQAVGAAILIPTGIALLLPAFSPQEQIRAIALLAAVSGVAFAAGPSIGGTLINTVGWWSIFLINVPTGLVALVMGHRFIGLDEERTGADSRLPDVAGAVLLLFGVGSLALAIVQGNTWGWGDVRIVTAFLAAACLIGTAIWRAARVPVPAIELDLFRARRYTIANIAIFAFAIGLAAKLLCDVLFMTSIWHYSELKTGLAVSASPLVTAAVASAAARIAIRIGSGPAAGLGGALYAMGCLWYVIHMGAHPRYVAAYLPGTALTGIGIAFILPTLTSTALIAVPTSRLAAGAGINSMIRQLGAVLGVALFVAIIGSPAPSAAITAFHHGWAFAASSSALAALATVALRQSPAVRRRSLGMPRSRARSRVT
jgi:EmrB/QacA subfamily drug resistance transporter